MKLSKLYENVELGKIRKYAKNTENIQDRYLSIYLRFSE